MKCASHNGVHKIMSKASFLSSLQASLITVGTYRETYSGLDASLPGGVQPVSQ